MTNYWRIIVEDKEGKKYTSEPTHKRTHILYDVRKLLPFAKRIEIELVPEEKTKKKFGIPEEILRELGA